MRYDDSDLAVEEFRLLAGEEFRLLTAGDESWLRTDGDAAFDPVDSDCWTARVGRSEPEFLLLLFRAEALLFVFALLFGIRFALIDN